MLLQLTPYARDEFDLAATPCADQIESARRICARAQMAFGLGGSTKKSTGFRIDTKRKYGTSVDLWVLFPDTLARLADRFVGVLIENRPGLRVLAEHDGPDTVHFVDPPYLPAVRVPGRAYRHEMSVADHIELLAALRELKGMVCLSGYASDLYSNMLPDWKCITKSVRASANRGTKMANEVLWINPECAERGGQGVLF